MSNHVHFFLECSYEQAQTFINELKRHHSRYLSHKYGLKETLRDVRVDIQRIDFCNESPERVIAYVQMNCVAANLCLTPFDYPWGTGQSFFRIAPAKGTPLSFFSKRKLRAILHCKKDLPPDWILGENGYILPESYVKVRFVESLFRTPKRMNYFLQNSSKARKKLESESADRPGFRDQVIVSAIGDLCRSLFQQSSISELDPEQLSELLKQIRFRFSANVEQIARVTAMTYEQVVRCLDQV